MLINQTYYLLKPFIPRRLQIVLRRALITYKLKSCQNWPIDEKSSRPPDNWSGWPENKQFALLLTHDVESYNGHDKCYQLADLEKRLGFKSSFNFVPQRYQVSTELRKYLMKNAFEVGVHGLKHDGKLYRSRKLFLKRAARINYYLKEWQSVGFRSPAMHHNLDWIHDLNIQYDASTFDTDPFEPQANGVGTIFPFWVQGNSNHNGYVELPYTLPQDFTLFILMREKTIHIWKKKLDWIAEKGGMALLNVHPDYMNFTSNEFKGDLYPAALYYELLYYVKSKYAGKYWLALPRQIAQFWKEN